MKYQVNYYDPANGATSAIDIIEAPEGYTAEQYVTGCAENAEPEYAEMLHAGEVSLETIEE